MAGKKNQSWYKAGESSIQAHLVKACGTKLMITACNVALNRALAVPATSATMRCPECRRT